MNPPVSQLQKHPNLEKVQPPPTTLPPSHLQTCAHCDAPLDALQRYCLSCGTRNPYVSNPAVDFLAGRRTNKRLVPKQADVGKPIGGTGLTTHALPWLVGSTIIALVLGLLIGNSGDNDIAKALANQKAPVVNVNGGGGGATTATAAATSLTSDFTLDKGYTVQVATIPQSSDQAAADAAKQDATSKGAKDVGLINPADFTIDPAPQTAGDYVIYSGEFKDKAAAEKALKGLKAKFADAKVVAVTASGSSAAADKAAASTGDVDLSKYKASSKKQAEDKAKVKDLNEKTGDDYVDGQNNLDPVTTIPGDPNQNTDPNALPGGD